MIRKVDPIQSRIYHADLSIIEQITLVQKMDGALPEIIGLGHLEILMSAGMKKVG